jgi:hypothetical protein
MYEGSDSIDTGRSRYRRRKSSFEERENPSRICLRPSIDPESDCSQGARLSFAEARRCVMLKRVRLTQMCRVLAASATPIVLSNQACDNGGQHDCTLTCHHTSPFAFINLINTIHSLLYSRTSAPSSRLSGLIPHPPQLRTRGSRTPREHKETCSVYGAGYQCFSSCTSHSRHCVTGQQY